MDSFNESAWDLPLDYTSFIDDGDSPDFSWVNQSPSFDIDFSQTSSAPQEHESYLKECSKKRARTNCGSNPGTKACRERLRREKLNDSFLDLNSILEPGRPSKTDKLAILTDAVRVLSQLQTEAEEYKEENRKLKEEIESLKAEKTELREEKKSLKAEKEKMEQQLTAMAGQLTAMAVPTSGLMSPYPSAYHNKMALYPTSYGMYPMWHYLPQSTRDTSRDHELRPPAA